MVPRKVQDGREPSVKHGTATREYTGGSKRRGREARKPLTPAPLGRAASAKACDTHQVCPGRSVGWEVSDKPQAESPRTSPETWGGGAVQAAGRSPLQCKERVTARSPQRGVRRTRSGLLAGRRLSPTAPKRLASGIQQHQQR